VPICLASAIGYDISGNTGDHAFDFFRQQRKYDLLTKVRYSEDLNTFLKLLTPSCERIKIRASTSQQKPD
jgi:hypothetical protein